MGGDSIDTFLEGLGLKVVKTAEDIPAATPLPGKTRLMVAKLNDEFIVHCFRTDFNIIESDLAGHLLRGQWTYQADLPVFSEKYESTLHDFGMLYHKDPPVPVGREQAIVSYQLEKMLDDLKGEHLLGSLKIMNDYLYTLKL